MQCNAMQYNTIQYNTIQYNTIQCNTIQYNTIQYNTIQHNTICKHAHIHAESVLISCVLISYSCTLKDISWRPQTPPRRLHLKVLGSRSPTLIPSPGLNTHAQTPFQAHTHTKHTYLPTYVPTYLPTHTYTSTKEIDNYVPLT